MNLSQFVSERIKDLKRNLKLLKAFFWVITVLNYYFLRKKINVLKYHNF